jgi:hypothetical protein
MKKLIEKFKKLPLKKKLFFSTMLLVIYPFVEAFINGATGWYDIPIHSLVLLGIAGLLFAYLIITGLVIPVGYWIYLGGKWVINLFKKKN